ncbi:serine/threonine protein kinase [Verrucomicrobiales bacterium]|nr:serine/threonine protein kinase [Verrucomicrobiales bacterium]
MWILLEVTETAHAAHLSGRVHRDIKPGNIMIRPDDQTCLIDFGIALSKQQPGNSLASGVAGTPAYMSPEQTRSEGHLVDRRSDIFSLGVVFYELLAGKRPFLGRDFHTVFEQIQSGVIPKLPATNPPITKEVQRICKKCLALRASERYQDARELHDDLRCFLHPEEEVEMEPAELAVFVPKGLRSFEESDSDFFFQLLLGPFDRHGLPDSVRFWKTRIEAQSTGDGAFRIGSSNVRTTGRSVLNPGF